MTRRFYINGRFLTQRTTGVQRFAREIVRALDHELTINLLPGETWTLIAPQTAASPDFELKTISLVKAGQGSGHFWEQLSLPIMARRGVLLSLANSSPVLHPRSCVVIHDAAVYRRAQNYGLSYRLLHQSLGRVLSRTATLATVSEFSRRELSDVLKMKPVSITVVPNGCEHINRVTPDLSVLPRLGLGHQRYFLFVGSPAPHKNVETAMAAFQKAGLTDFKLVLCGFAKGAVFGRSGADTLSEGIIQAQDLSDAGIAGLYHSAAAFVFPSRYEGFGIPPLEAIVHDCPVLASDIPPCREVLGDAALFFEPDDVETLSNLMRKMIAEVGTRDGLIARGRERRLRYTWSSSAASLLALARSS